MVADARAMKRIMMKRAGKRTNNAKVPSGGACSRRSSDALLEEGIVPLLSKERRLPEKDSLLSRSAENRAEEKSREPRSKGQEALSDKPFIHTSERPGPARGTEHA